MRKITQAEFDAIERDEYGRKICPTGDYSAVKIFGDGCSFGVRCSFGDGCSFGEWCRFGVRCSFGDGCSFGEWCRFGERCSFGEWCSFGVRCSFEGGEVQNGKYFACDRIGSERRKTYFFKDDKGQMFVRTGCWFSELDKFVERVKSVHGGTRYEREYLAAVELAKIVLTEDE